MDTRRTEILEVLSHLPSRPRHSRPLLFVHGAYTGAWCWEEHFLPYFADQGYSAYALSLRGHGTSWGADNLDWWSIHDYVEDVRRVVAELDETPVLIGHSMGGFVVQKYLETAEAPAAVLMNAVPPQGLLNSSLILAVSRPSLMLDLNRILEGEMVEPDALRQALFAQPVPPEDLTRYFQHMQRESRRALWDMTLFNLPQTFRMSRPPMLVLGAENDALIPASDVRATGAIYGVGAEIFPDLGHGMMLERDWTQVAERIRSWLDEQGQ